MSSLHSRSRPGRLATRRRQRNTSAAVCISTLVRVQLRALKPDDVPEIESWRDAHAQRFLQDGWLDNSPTDHRSTYAVVGMQDGVPVGVVQFHFYNDAEALVLMLVSPAARGQGVGRQLLQRALATTPASICKADIMRENEGSARCALAAGFSEYLKPQADGWRFFAWTRDGRSYEPSWA